MRVLGLSSSLCSSEDKEEEEIVRDSSLTPVYVNVYDLTHVNNYLYWFGLGIFHSGIEGGDCKTLVFVQISPSNSDFGETLCSLNFASRVRGIETGLARKLGLVKPLLWRARLIIEE